MKLKKMLALLLALVMVFALAACGEDTTNDDSKSNKSNKTEEPKYPVVGTWEGDLVMDGEQMGLDDFDGNFKIHIVWEFDNKDGYELSVDEDELKKSIADFEDAMVQYMCDTLYASFEDMEMDKDAADAAMVDQYGMSVTEYANSIVDEMDIENSLLDEMDDMSEKGEYRVEDDEIYITADGDDEEVCYEFVIEGDKIKLTSDDEDFSDMLETFGADELELTKVD